MRTIHVGVIGTGFIGPVHIEALRRLGFVQVDAIADVSLENVQKKALQLHVPKGYGSYQELIDDPEIESVHICTPNYLHYDMVKAVLKAGKHVICDKPLALNAAQARELADCAKKAGVVAAVNFNVRFYPLLHNVKAMIAAGELGQIFAINGSYQQDWLLKETDYSWRLDSEQSGISRAVADIGSHWVDCAEFISGLRISQVFADFATFYPTRKKPLKPVETYSGKLLTNVDYQDVPINTEDYATVLLHFQNGAHGSLTVNQVAAGYKNRLYLEVFGSEKSLRFNSERPNELWIGERDSCNGELLRDPSLMHSQGSGLACYPGGHNEGFPDTFKQCFAKVYTYILQDGVKKNLPVCFPTFEDGVREVTLCDHIVTSAKEARWVKTLENERA